MIPGKKDVCVLRELAKELLEYASLPVMRERTDGWKALNSLKPVRPMVIIDQLPWNEMDFDGSLTCLCEDKKWRKTEEELRRAIFRAKYLPADAVVPDHLTVRKLVGGVGDFGLPFREDTAPFGDSEIVGHYYYDQMETEEQLDAARMAPVTYDREGTEELFDDYREIFGGIIEVRLDGIAVPNGIWDYVACHRGVEHPLYDMTDRPEFIHKMMRKFTDGLLGQLDCLQERGLLAAEQNYIHCTGAFTDELPAPGFDPEHVRPRDMWTYGLAQMLGAVSPEMYEEFELSYAKEWCSRFGLVYYGCCDPLDRMMDRVRKLPNLRKVSMSPWTDPEAGAAGIAGDFVFSSKPSPAALAAPSFDGDAVRENLRGIKRAALGHGCPLEFILKDVSTIRRDVGRLIEWERIAMETALE